MKELNVAISAAKEAGKILMKYSNREKGIRFKDGAGDLVTNADIESQEKIISVIKKAFSRHEFLSEEMDEKPMDAENLWIIDPLDGTTNFAYNFPHFCTSIAYQKKNRLIIGVVFDPVKKEMFCAAKGKGAFLNGKRICVSKANKLEECLMGSDSPYDASMRHSESEIKMKLPAMRGMRQPGSAALDMCYVACSRLDACWFYFAYPWDVSAGAVIVREAGGMVTNEAGRQWTIKDSGVVASNKIMHEKILSVLKDARK